MGKCISELANVLNDPSFKKHFLRQLHSGNPKRVAASLARTVKTHKDAGDISCRLIHVSVDNPLGPLGMYLADQLRTHLPT